MYHLFIFEVYHITRIFDHYIGSFETLDEAKQKYIDEKIVKYSKFDYYDEAEIMTEQDGKLVLVSSADWHGDEDEPLLPIHWSDEPPPYPLKPVITYPPEMATPEYQAEHPQEVDALLEEEWQRRLQEYEHDLVNYENRLKEENHETTT